MTSMIVNNHLLYSWLYTESTDFFVCQQTLSDIKNFIKVDFVNFANWCNPNITVYDLLFPPFYRINVRFHSEVVDQMETRLSTKA